MATGRKTAYREFDHPKGIGRAPFKQNGYREVNVEQRRRSSSPQPIPKTAYRDVAAASPRPAVGQQQQQQRGYRDVEPKFAAGQPKGGGVPQRGYRDVGAKSPSTPKTPLGYRDVPPATPRKSQEAMGSEPVMVTADSITGSKVVRERLDWHGGCSVVKKATGAKAAAKSAGPRSGKTPRSSTLLVNKSVIGGSDDSGGGEYANVIKPIDGTLAMPSTATVAPTASLDLPHLGPSSPKDKYNRSKKNNRSRNRHESPTVIDYEPRRTKRQSRASRHSNKNKNGTPATRRNRGHEKRTGANGRGNGGCFKRHKCIFCILITVIIVSALVALAIGLGLYFGAAKKDDVGKYTGRIDALYESFCRAKFHEDEEYDEECGLGLAPTSSTCETGGHCFRYNYESHVTDIPHHNTTNGSHIHRSWTIVNHSGMIPPISVEKSNTHFCRLQHDGKSQLGVCDKEKGCNRIYAGGQDEPSWYEEPRWEDTCDHPSQCWHVGVESHTPWQMAEVKDDYAPPVANRSECIKVAAQSDKDVSDRCQKSISALVMLQHRRCIPGKNRTAKAPCPGLPVFLRVCHACPPPSEKYIGHSGCDFALGTDDCTYTCSGATRTPMPTGTKCALNYNKSVEAYCFMGVCLEAHKYDSKSACGKGKKSNNERRRKK